MLKIIIGLTAVVTIAAGVPANAGQCPDTVLSAIEKAHAGAKMVSCTHETEDGESFYEATIRTSAGKTLDLELSTDGTIVETWENIPTSELPAAALQTLRTKHPNAKVTEAERLTTDEGEVSFDILFVSGGRKQVMTVTKTGDFVGEADDEVQAEAAGDDHQDDHKDD